MDFPDPIFIKKLIHDIDATIDEHLSFLLGVREI